MATRNIIYKWTRTTAPKYYDYSSRDETLLNGSIVLYAVHLYAAHASESTELAILIIRLAYSFEQRTQIIYRTRLTGIACTRVISTMRTRRA